MRNAIKGGALVLLLALSLLLAACAEAAPSDPPHLPPNRAAVLFSSLAEIWQEAGGVTAITVGESVERGFADASAVLVDDGVGKNINTERLLAAAPDLVIASADVPAQVRAAELARTAGIPTLLLRVEGFDDYLAALDVMCAITGDRSGYLRAVAMRSEIDALCAAASAAQSRTVLFIRTGSTNASTKPKQASDHFACAMLEELGCRNVMDDAPILLDGLNMEAVLALDPELIFFSTMGNEEAARAHICALLDDPAWQRLSAVRNGSVFVLPKELFHFKPNARFGESYRYLYDILMGGDHA